MGIEDKQLKPGDMVVLVGLPPGFLDDLPLENQTAITDMIGKPVEFCGITRTSKWERVELRFEEYPGRGPLHIRRSELHSANEIGYSYGVPRALGPLLVGAAVFLVMGPEQ